MGSTKKSERKRHRRKDEDVADDRKRREDDDEEDRDSKRRQEKEHKSRKKERKEKKHSKRFPIAALANRMIGHNCIRHHCPYIVHIAWRTCIMHVTCQLHIPMCVLHSLTTCMHVVWV